MSQILNATAVMPLTETNIEVLRAIQLNHEIPEGAKYIAFLEDGDAVFLEDFERPVGSFILPSIRVLSYYTNIPIEFEA